MDLIQVKKKDYSLGKLVELNWDTDTLIWAERFQDIGDFELTTQSISSVRSLLPERSMCTLLDTNSVMWVDSHNIETDDEGVDELVVKGRTLDWFLLNRVWANAPHGKKVTMAKKYTVRQAVEVWVWNAIVNGTGNDRINTSASYSSANKLPNVIVTDSIPPASDGPSQARKVQNGYVYDQMRTLLSSGKVGVRIIRPNGTKGRKVTVAGDGTFSTDVITDIEDLRFDFYRGRDISDRVVFSWSAGHLENPAYMFSSENLKTGAFVDGAPRDHYFTDPDIVAGSNTGWNRMDAYVDGGEKDSGVDADDFEESLEDQGLRAVRKDGARINTIDAQISPFINYKYGKDYRLGDRVKVQGRYGASSNKWVTEFIRTHDKEGDRGFPTLSSSLA